MVARWGRQYCLEAGKHQQSTHFPLCPPNQFWRSGRPGNFHPGPCLLVSGEAGKLQSTFGPRGMVVRLVCASSRALVVAIEQQEPFPASVAVCFGSRTQYFHQADPDAFATCKSVGTWHFEWVTAGYKAVLSCLMGLVEEH